MPPHPPAALTGEVRLQKVAEGDLPVFFEQQCDADALRMAAFVPRDRDAFMAHWAKLLADQTLPLRTVLFDGQVAGHISSWEGDGKRLVGYWIGKQHWGKGVATAALRAFLAVVQARPLYAHVAKHNIGSIRVLTKCGFKISLEETAALDAPSDGVEELVLKLAAAEALHTTEESGRTSRCT
jgi:RimJ/RimL family protein N-acetyltransferase